MIAVEKLRQYLEVDPENSELALQLLEALVSSGDIDGAFELLESSGEKAQQDYRFKAWYAHLNMAVLKFDTAISTYEEMFADGYVYEGHKINCAYAHYHCGNNKSALALLNDCSSDALEHLILKVRCMSAEGDLSPAIRLLESEDFTSSSPKLNSQKSGLLALLYLDYADYQKAQEYAQEALNQDRSNFDANLVNATLSLFKLEINQAIKRISALYAQYPNVGRVIILKALLEMYQNNLERAAELYEKVCVLMPEHVGSKVNLAWCYFLNGDSDKAEVVLKQSIELDRTFAESYGGMSLIKVKQGKWAESKELAKTALRLDSACASALFSRALYLKHLGKEGEADNIMNGLISFKGEISDRTIKEVVLERLKTG
ncbi:tetratricopeptide repeat protein [Vibrio coralliilyticus]|uniref:Tetratricopeptide repeat protein n=1 Tax=Vibrio coralliilyticus TaxID=190893 RepID=A0AAP6ZLQ2_9VIBR|nr:tetratricopeptide repeat protein [Vibrio coralliilyticus]NOJ23577.1 tetratricopeptide repeat protein [Vibrio coralliilyticus]